MPERIPKAQDTINLFTNATLTLRPNGAARLESVVDPETAKLELEGADQLQSFKAIPISGDVFVVRATTLKNPENQSVRSHTVELSKTAGADGLYLTAVAGRLTGRAEYAVVIKDGENQDEIQAELIPTLTVDNATSRDFSGVLKLALNEPQRFRGPVFLGAKSADGRVESATGAVVLPVADRFEAPANAERSVNIASALGAGATKPSLPITLQQKISASLFMQPGAQVGARTSQTTVADSSFTLGGIASARPAGEYTLYDTTPQGPVETGFAQVGEYTEKGKTVEVAGLAFRTLEAKGEWVTRAVAPQASSDGSQFDSVTVEGTVSLQSQSERDRRVTVQLPHGFFRLEELEVRAGTRRLVATVDANTNIPSIQDVLVRAGQTVRLTVRALGNVPR